MLMRQCLELKNETLFIHLYRIIVVAFNFCYNGYVSAYLSNNQIVYWRYFIFIWSPSNFMNREQTNLKVFEGSV